MSLPEPIRIDEVLAELTRLERVCEEGPPGFTGKELAARLDVAVNTAQEYLRRLVTAGRVEFVGKRAEVNIAGTRCRVPVYRLVSCRQ